MKPGHAIVVHFGPIETPAADLISHCLTLSAELQTCSAQWIRRLWDSPAGATPGPFGEGYMIPRINPEPAIVVLFEDMKLLPQVSDSFF